MRGRAGAFSACQQARDYGVVLRDDLSVDEQATQRRRQEMESVTGS
jgi:hypothetical protein